ncbi:hypothetical protein ACSX1A_01450 [Pontibacter sp. MBLB2868]|uniref:hypothetical protein n=1 Tax=Pontibacter sp. MBLB2868 TaxID=3451555 RepID=UPI003F753DFC
MKDILSIPNIPLWVTHPSLLKTFKQFLGFLKKPTSNAAPLVSANSKARILLHLLLTEILVKGFVVAVVVLLYSLLDINLRQSNLHIIFGQRSVYFVLLLVVVYGPLKDELIFRLPLVYSRRFVLIALAVFLVGSAPLVMQEAGLSLTHYAAAAFVCCLLATFVLLSPRLHAYIRQPWKTDYTGLFHIISFVFALQYLVNYPYINLPLFMLPVLVLLQWIEGLFLGYTRLYLGFKWSMAQHIFNKTLLLLVFYSFYSIW